MKLKIYFFKKAANYVTNFYHATKNSISYIKDLVKYLFLDTNTQFGNKLNNIYPCIFDKTILTEIEPIYFLQDAWLAKKIFQCQPKKHYDVGSSIKALSIISQFLPVTMVDIRPPSVNLPELDFIKGSITDLPFKDNTISSISSICVVEHIGLGRYGDQLDQYGSEKAIGELIRVTKKGGDIFISVPIDKSCEVCFNAHRTFTRKYLLKLFHGLKLVDEKYIYGKFMYNNYRKNMGFGTGLYHFNKSV